MPERFTPSQEQFPLLDRAGALVGWTGTPPHFQGMVLRHFEAERIVGTPLVIVPVLLLVDAHMRRAVGAANPEGVWVLAVAHASCIRRVPITIRE